MRLLPAILLLLTATAASGQRRPGDTMLKGSTIEVIQTYKPQVRDAPKPQWLPQLPQADTSYPRFSYEVPQQTLYYPYSSQPIRPLALKQKEEPAPFENYVKVGAGNLATLYLDAGIGGISGDGYKATVQLQHLSQKGAIRQQQSSLTGLSAAGTLNTDKKTWNASIDAFHNRYHLYGYDRSAGDLPKDSVKQYFTSARASIEMGNNAPLLSFHYKPRLSLSTFISSNKTSENNFTLLLPFSKTLDTGLTLGVDVLADVTLLSRNGNGTANNLFAVTPAVVWQKGTLSGRGAIGFAAGKDQLYVLPDISAFFSITDVKMTFGAGWTAAVRKNTYEQIAVENPYVSPQFDVRQSKRDEIFASAGGSIGNHISYNGRVSWWSFNDLTTYLNQPPDLKRFQVVYNNVNALSVMASLRYNLSGRWAVGGSLTNYTWYNSSEEKVWHQPKLVITSDLVFNPVEKLYISAYLNTMAGMNVISTSGRVVTISPVTDIGAGAEYEILRRLNAFLQINNLLNSRYQRWYGYEAYGINVFGGLRLKF